MRFFVPSSVWISFSSQRLVVSHFGNDRRKLRRLFGAVEVIDGGQPLELDERVLVEHDVIDVMLGHAGLREAEVHRMVRETRNRL